MKKPNRYYIVLLLSILAYGALLVLLPQRDDTFTQRYGLNTNSLRIISLTFAIPLLAIWFIAFTGFIRVKEYAKLVGKHRDGYGLRLIGNGLMVLAFSLPINTLVNTLRNYVNTQNPHWIPTTTIISNYLSLVLSLAGIWLIAHGARVLVRNLKEKPHPLNQAIMAAVFTAVSILYTYVTLTDPLRQVPGGLSGRAAYYLPDGLVLSTVVVPYIILWYLGFRAAYHLRLYSKNVPGVLYRKALSYLAAGVASVVASIMVLRLATSMSSFLNDLSLKVLLAVVYVLLVIIGLGYFLIALGAKRLKKIEEV